MTIQKLIGAQGCVKTLQRAIISASRAVGSLGKQGPHGISEISLNEPGEQGNPGAIWAPPSQLGDYF